MPVAEIDGLEVYYETRGSGAPLLMLAPGGFDSTIDKWLNATAWKEIDALDKLSSEFQIIAYDRRESARSGPLLGYRASHGAYPVRPRHRAWRGAGRGDGDQSARGYRPRRRSFSRHFRRALFK